MAGVVSAIVSAVSSGISPVEKPKPLVNIDYKQAVSLESFPGKVALPLAEKGKSVFKGVNSFCVKLAGIRDRTEVSSLFFEGNVIDLSTLKHHLIFYVWTYEKAQRANALCLQALSELSKGIEFGITTHKLEDTVRIISDAEGRFRGAAQHGLSSLQTTFNGLKILQRILRKGLQILKDI